MLARIVTKEFFLELRAEFKKDRLTNGAAALAFYSMLALFPAAIFVLTLLPYLPIANLEQAIMDLLKDAMPGEAAGLFEQTVRNVVSNRKAGLLSFGLILTLWSASSGVYAVMQELNVVYGVEETRPFWKARGVALGLTLALALLLVGALVLAVGGGGLQAWLGRRLGWSSVLMIVFAALRWLVIAVALLSAIALLYRFGPSGRRRFAIVTPGTLAATAALGAAALVFNLYVANFGSYDKTYGSLGAVIALLMWLFVTGLALLFGAEVDAVASRRPVGGREEMRPASRAPRLA